VTQNKYVGPKVCDINKRVEYLQTGKEWCFELNVDLNISQWCFLSIDLGPESSPDGLGDESFWSHPGRSSDPLSTNK